MAWTSYELHDALALCDIALDGQDMHSCLSGVFMENVVGGLSGDMGHTSAYIRTDNAHYPCDAIADLYVEQCYFYQTTHMLKVFKYDLTQVAEACLQAPEAAHYLCFASFGRDVAAQVNNDPARAIKFCELAPKGNLRSRCMAGAVQNGFWDPSGASRALKFCAMLEDDFQTEDSCYQTIITRAANLLADTSTKEWFCSEVPQYQQSSCAENLRL